jgi:hypothetical protein
MVRVEYNVVPISPCKWLFKEGEDARTIARVAYSNPNLYSDVLKANPYTWEPGMRLIVPNTSGLLTNRYENEGYLTLLRRMLPETDVTKYLKSLHAWNGDDVAPGEYVYLHKKR